MPTGPLFEESTNESIRSAIPDPLVTIIEVATHLGDGATIAAVAVLLYWFSAEQRRIRIYIVAVGLCALGLSTLLKGVIARDRPSPEYLAFAPEAYSGYSFPSAHALGTAALLTMLVITLSVGTRRQRVAAGAAIVATVMLSRVVIGVHFVGDVIVGAAVGIGLVLALFRGYPTISPTRAFVLAIGLGIAGLALGAREHSVLVVGAATGASVAWVFVRDHDPNPTGAAVLMLGVLALPTLIAIRAIERLVGFGELAQYNVATIAASYAVVTALVILVPVIAERLDDWPIVVRLQSVLPFEGRRVDPTQLHPPADTRDD